MALAPAEPAIIKYLSAIRRLFVITATLAGVFPCCAYGYQNAGQKQPAVPTVDFQAVVERDSVRRGERVPVFFLITNKSNVELRNPTVTLLNPGALVPEGSADPRAPLSASPHLTNVLAFGTHQSQSVLTVGPNAEFAPHRFIFVLDYTWDLDGKPMSSAQTTTLTLPVVRQFEEEAKGLPGGTAPLLYLVLPIIPAILAFEFFNSIRKGEGARMPQFKSEYIVPSFLVAVLLGFITLFVARRNATVDYSSSLSFAIVIAISFALGSAIVGILWLWDRFQWHRKGFNPKDSPEKYLRKLLLQCKDGQGTWATATVEGQKWEGILLTQPNKTHALGARMQISVRPGSVPSWNELIEAIDREGKIRNRKSLRRWLRHNNLNVGYLEKIKRAEENIDQPVATEGLEKFHPGENANWPLKPIIRPVN